MPNLRTKVDPHWALLEQFLRLLPESSLNKLTGGMAEGSQFFSHYMAGSGTPMEYKISPEHWGALIQQANKQGWESSTNPEAPKDSQFSRVTPSNYNTGGTSNEIYRGIMDIYGNNTTIRKTPVSSTNSSIPDTSYSLQDKYDFNRGDVKSFYGESREISPVIGYLLRLFDKNTFSKDIGNWINVNPGKGKSFPILSEYLKKGVVSP